MIPSARACPFCGSRRVNVLDRSQWHEVHCTDCGAKGPSGPTPETAKERWNWRRRAKGASS